MWITPGCHQSYNFFETYKLLEDPKEVEKKNLEKRHLGFAYFDDSYTRGDM